MAKCNIAGKEYYSKNEVQARARAILHKYNPFEELNSEDSYFMSDLLKYHPRYAEKEGSGIKAIIVGLNLSEGREFQILRTDGSKAAFSYAKCTKREVKQNQDINLKRACRNVIKPIIAEFRKNYFTAKADLEGKVKCPLSGERISINESHIDHKYPMTFERIYEDWKKEYHVVPEKVALSQTQERGSERTFADKSLEQSFIDYHNKRAVLRVLSQRGNLILSRRGR